MLVVICLIVLILLVFLLFNVCKRCYCVHTRQRNTRYGIIVIGKSQNFAKELLVNKILIWNYTIFVLPIDPENEKILQVVVCICREADFMINSRVNCNETEVVKLENTSVKASTSHPCFETMSSYEERNNCFEFKTFSASCAICLEEFEVREKICILNCKHGFHRKCICHAIFFHTECPCCKSNSGFKTICLSNNQLAEDTRSYGTVRDALMLP